MPKIYLLSRTLDPLLGVFTGLLAYHLSETNPRSAPPPGHSLRELLAWKWGDARQRRVERDAAADMVGSGAGGAEWERMRKELEGDGKQ